MVDQVKKLRKIACLVAVMCVATVSMAQAQANEGNAPKNPDMIEIGRLGQSIAETKIYSNMSTKASVLWKLKSYQYLVINDAKYDKWLAVLLQNGKTGYIMKEAVAELPYMVEIPKDYKFGRTKQTPTSRGGSTGRAISNPKDKQEMLEYSYKFIGTRYVWGGNSLTGGIDCSGFVKELFEKIDINLPRTAAEQAKVGQKVERLEDLQPGDRLYFWDKKRGKIGHTGIFLGYFKDGGAYFIHSSTNNKGVATDDLRNKHWTDMLVGARR
ncbi:MAG: C40 family peptidase [Fimbriimonadaceae bacterium]